MAGARNQLGTESERNDQEMGDKGFEQREEQSGIIDVSISAGRANALALGLLPLIATLLIIPYWGIHGALFFESDTSRFFRLIVLVPVAVVSIVLHELLHAAGFVLFGRLPWSAVEFGIHWKALAPFAHCKTAMPASVYRASVVLPAVVLGVVPYSMGLLIGLAWLSGFGVLMLVAAVGDLIVLWVTRRVAGDTRVIDHPRRPGCWVLADEKAEDGGTNQDYGIGPMKRKRRVK
jgi:hypothetical protein